MTAGLLLFGSFIAVTIVAVLLGGVDLFSKDK